MLEDALRYAAELGWYVFPCHTPLTKEGWSCSCEAWRRKKYADYNCGDNAGKHPRTQHGLDDATIDPEQIREWWQRWPNANIGINCGLSGLLVIDLDQYKDIYQGHDLDLDEDTVTAITGGGGCHLFYKLEDADQFGNRNKELPPGIDIRGHGGYVVAAPSLHRSGNRYQWELEYSPFDIELKPIPPKLREILAAGRTRSTSTVLFDTSPKYNGDGISSYGKVALNAEYEKVAAAASGTRNNTLNDAAFAIGRLVAGGEIDYNVAFAQLKGAAMDAGLSDEEAEQTTESGMAAGMEHPRSSKPLDEAESSVEETLAVVDCPDPALLRTPIKKIFDDIPEGKADDLQLWAIDKANDLASLNASDLARFRIELSKRGVKKGFLDRDLSKIIKEAKQAKRTDDALTPEEQESIWEKCIEDMESLGYTFRMNELDDCVEVNGQRLNDGIDAQIVMEMYDRGWTDGGDNGAGGANYLRLAWTAQAHKNRYHPVKDFLNSLVWDGKDWIAELERYIKDKHPQIIYEDGSRLPVFGAFLKRWGIGAVGKALAEGDIRVQNPMLVLDGAQDAGKSTLSRFLCPMSDGYYIESHISPDSSDHNRYLATRLVWEVAELGATTRKADRESLKAFLTKQDVTFRVPYGKHPVTKQALASFIGTINPEIGFLNDPTGHRRFLPVELVSIDFAYKQNIDPVQLWAQFVALYRAGESPKLTPEEKEMANAIRSGHEIEDQYTGFITKLYHVDKERTAATPANLDWSATTTDVVEQLTLNGVTGANTTNIGLSLVKLGLTKKRQQVKGIQETRWYGICRNEVGFKMRASGL